MDFSYADGLRKISVIMADLVGVLLKEVCENLH